MLSVIMLIVIMLNAVSAECRYAGCCGTIRQWHIYKVILSKIKLD
jgi:hypothetical protein